MLEEIDCVGRSTLTNTSTINSTTTYSKEKPYSFWNYKSKGVIIGIDDLRVDKSTLAFLEIGMSISSQNRARKSFNETELKEASTSPLIEKTTVNNPSEDRGNKVPGWKGIAEHLKCSVATAQRMANTVKTKAVRGGGGGARYSYEKDLDKMAESFASQQKRKRRKTPPSIR